MMVTIIEVMQLVMLLLIMPLRTMPASSGIQGNDIGVSRNAQLTCHLDIGTGTCYNLTTCPEDDDPLLVQFPIYCKLQDGGRGVCCSAKQEDSTDSTSAPVVSPTIGQRCRYKSPINNGICRDVGDCPVLSHIENVNDFVFCDKPAAAICCPKEGQGTSPKVQQEGDDCTLPQGISGTCKIARYCMRNVYNPFAQEPDSYCNRTAGIICCPKQSEVTSTTTSVTFPESSSQPGYTLRRGDQCSLSTGERGTCWLLSECTESNNVISITNAEYCHEPSLLVCCPSSIGHTTGPQIPTLPREGESCVQSDGTHGTCVSSLSCSVDKYRPSKTTILTYCDARRLFVCCPIEREKEADVVSVSAPIVNFECGNSYPEPVLRYGRSRKERLRKHRSRETPSRHQSIETYDERRVDHREVLRVVSVKYMALVGMRDGDYINWICNAVLINERWVLMAAHCFLLRGSERSNFFSSQNQLGSSLVVRLGDYDFKDDTDMAHYEDFGVEKVVTYPDYTFYKAYHDLALVKLSKSAILGKYINPVCLPWTTSHQQNLQGLSLMHTGWGASWPNGAYLSYPHSVSLTVESMLKCREIFGLKPDFKQIFPNGIGKDTLCAGNPNAEEFACHGNFGGPLVYEDSSKRYVLAGVEFRSFGCDKQRDPALYVNIHMTPYLSWIKHVAFSDRLFPGTLK